MLHLVQTLIRESDQNVFLITVRREYCNSIIHSQSNTGLHGLHRGPEISANAARQRVRLFAIGMHKQKREFIAADAKSVVRCSQRFAQCGGGSLQKQIALRMPVSVVNLFELMQVKKDQGQVLVVSKSPVQFFFEMLLEEPPIVEAGEWVGGGIDLQFFQVLILH